MKRSLGVHFALPASSRPFSAVRVQSGCCSTSSGCNVDLPIKANTITSSFPRAWNAAKRFQSSSPEESQGKHGYDLQQRTRQILDLNRSFPVDDAEMWKEAEQVVKLWLKQSSETTPPLERVEYCLKILDRLDRLLPQGAILYASMFEADLLNAILLVWRNGVSIDNDGASSSRRLRLHLSPSFLAEKVDKYRWSSLVQPDAKTYNLILDGASFYPPQDGVLFADSLLEKLIQVSNETGNLNLVDTISIGSVMKAWVKHKQPQKAQDWLRRMQDLSSHNNKYDDADDDEWNELQPNAIVYTTVISGWAKVGDAPRAEVLLQEQLQDYEQGNTSARPDTTTFNAVLDAWAKSKHPDAPQRAGAIVSQMQEWSALLGEGGGWKCEPDEYSFTSLVICWANSAKNGPEQAEGMLMELQTMATDGDTAVRPTIVAYNAVLHAYAQADKAEQADRLLQRMLDDETVLVRPDETTFNTVLSAWAKSKSPDAPLQAEALLADMQDGPVDTQPSVISYSSVLQCWAKSSSQGAAEHAEELLREMQGHAGNNPRAQPNIICYNIVLNAWGNTARQTRDPKYVSRAVRLLDELLQDKSLKPSGTTFRTVLFAIAGSTVTNKLGRAQVVMELMKRHRIQPNSNDQKLMKRLSKAANAKQ
jgi:pentatricopeptide repeat protein